MIEGRKSYDMIRGNLIDDNHLHMWRWYNPAPYADGRLGGVLDGAISKGVPPGAVGWFPSAFHSAPNNHAVLHAVPVGGHACSQWAEKRVMRVLENVSCACAVLRKELFEFSFDYPLSVDRQAGPKESLAYYLYSDKLKWTAMRMDPNGIPMAWYRQTGPAYWPAYVAWYGLVNLGHYLRRSDPKFLDIFLKQAAWLEHNAVVRSDGAVVWPMNLDYIVGSTYLKAPWVSAHAQGLVISALVRAWRITRRSEILRLLDASARIFQLDEDHGGIRTTLNGQVFYTEVPGGPSPGILDGFMTSLLGLYDLYVETANAEVKQLFEDGIGGLQENLWLWNYRNKWSWYMNRAYLSPPAYHRLHCVLLQTLALITANDLFAVFATRWAPEGLSMWDRAEIYGVFQYGKNVSRIQNRTWTQVVHSKNPWAVTVSKKVSSAEDALEQARSKLSA